MRVTLRVTYDGVDVYCLPDNALCKLDDERRSPLEMDECPYGCDECGGDCPYYAEDSEENWISVKDALPKPYIPALVHVRHSYGTDDCYSDIRICFRTGEMNKGVSGWSCGSVYTVTHWQPLPAPPEEEQEAQQ